MNQHVAKAEPDATGLTVRLAELRVEWTEGQRRLETLDAERAKIRDMLLRISGAIQVLEELTGGAHDSAAASGQ